MAHSVRFRIKKAHKAFMQLNPQFLGCCHTTKFASLFRQYAIEQGISAADIDNYLTRCIEAEERSAQAECEGTGPGARLFQAMFTDPATLKAKRLIVVADDEQHLTDAKSALQALGYEVIGQLCNDLDRCSVCGSSKADCVCTRTDLMEYIHNTGLSP